MITVGSLCSGYEGFGLALEMAGLDVELAFVADPDPAASAVLAHHYPHVPNLGDITAVDWRGVPQVDVLTAGYPCQPLSLAGRRAGTADERWIWDDVFAAVRILRPRVVLLENVAGHLSLGFGRVLGDLASIGFDARWSCVRASDVGAAHRRERVFVYAYPADSEGVGHGDAWAQGGSGLPAAAISDGHHALVPTPGARLGNCSSLTPGAARRRSLTRRQGANLDDWAALLPTPTAARYGSNQSPSPGAAVRLGLDSIDALLPTPRATDGTKGGPNQRGSSGDLMLSAAVQPGRWGKDAAAIARWEAVMGRPAPEPTEPGRSTAVRLAPRFVEWLIGLPDGWVCDPAIWDAFRETVEKRHARFTPTTARNAQLRLLGNGIVPQQAAYAWYLLNGVEARHVALP